MTDADRFKLLGTYRTPRFRVGQVVRCVARGKVVITGITKAPIPWPVAKKGKGRHTLVVFKDLAKSVRRESAQSPPPGVFREAGSHREAEDAGRRGEHAQTGDALLRGPQDTQAVRPRVVNKDRLTTRYLVRRRPSVRCSHPAAHHPSMRLEDCTTDLVPLLIKLVLGKPVSFIRFEVEPIVFDMDSGPHTDWLKRDADDRQCPVELKPDQLKVAEVQAHRAHAHLFKGLGCSRTLRA
jgi:hypothetical protein